tara:strand:- start:13586 stop:14611 length:1026 start_codon:yes stop_codon:yes gene_type:complete
VKLRDLASLVQGELVGDPEIEIKGVSEIQKGIPGTITFLHMSKYKKYIDTTKASAVLIGKDHSLDDISLSRIITDNPTIAFSKILDYFVPSEKHTIEIHNTAIIHESVKIDDNVSIGPYTVIEKDVIVGKNVKIGSNCMIGKNCLIRDESELNSLVTLYPNCKIGMDVIIHSGSVLGSDGFGFATEKGTHKKIPQIGGVEIGDNVEIGANCTIDRGTIGNTVIDKGTKLDNLVHIAHNVKIGKNCLLTAQTAVAGSSVIGDYVAFGGKASVAGHLIVGNKTQLAAKSGVTKSLEGGETYAGMPARKILDKNKQDALIGRLPEIVHLLKDIEKRLIDLEKNE